MKISRREVGGRKGSIQSHFYLQAFLLWVAIRHAPPCVQVHRVHSDCDKNIWQNREQEVTRATSYRCWGWDVRNYMGGLETYDGILSLAELLQLDTNNGSISVYWRGATNKWIGLSLAYWMWDLLWWRLGVMRIPDKTDGGSVLWRQQRKI